MVLCLSNRPHGTFLRFTHFTALVVLCLIISSLLVKAEEDPQPCTITNETTKKYFDLNPLKKTEGEDWIVEGYGINWTFRINVCSNLLYKVVDYDDISVYGTDKENNISYSLGKIKNNLYFRGEKLVMESVGYDLCKNTNNYRKSSIFSFICDQTVEGLGQPIFVTDHIKCAFIFEWRTPAACPTDPRGSGWGVFFTIFVIALIVYFVGGIVYNRMVHNASGVYQIPNWEFWSNTCDFLKDMILIILAQCPVINKPRRSGGRNYRNLPRDDAENVLIEEEFEEH